MAPKIRNLPWLYFIWQFMEANKEGSVISFVFHHFHSFEVGFNIFLIILI